MDQSNATSAFPLLTPLAESFHAFAFTMSNMKGDHTSAKVDFFYRKKDTDTFFKFLQDFRHRLLALKRSEVLPLNLSYQDLLSQHLKQVHPTHDPSHVPNMREYVRVEIEPIQFDEEYAEQLAEKGYGAWNENGSQSLDRWRAFAQTLMDSVYAYNWPPSAYQAAEQCPICLQTMVWTKPTVCGHVFHVHCLMKYVLRHNNTCPLCRYPLPVVDDYDD
ncbi:hypothetical protein NPIL_235161 [Nephila pilipes]|uniref:RING-type domain-containing protein n=1 Tax=Nephila pilipes TaxID=299642 RepID=A0A8X6M6J6_NEPPI|nr:hypothetical protein NPIL_235161 [Nephila pilipes]